MKKIIKTQKQAIIIGGAVAKKRGFGTFSVKKGK